MHLFVGKPVHLYLPGNPNPHAATVANLNDDDTINIGYLSSNGDAMGANNIPFLHDPTGDEDFACCVDIPTEELSAQPKGKRQYNQEPKLPKPQDSDPKGPTS